MKDINYAVYTVFPFISKIVDFKRISIKVKYIVKNTFSGLLYSSPSLQLDKLAYL